MIRSHRSTVLHRTPLRPWLHGVGARVPDLLAPDDVLEA